MSLVSSSPQPTLAWSFDGSTTDYITGLTGTTTGTVTYSSGKYQQCISIFNVSGTSAASNLVTYTVSLGSTTGFTVATWVRMDGAQSAALQNTIIGLSGYPNSTPATLNFFNIWQRAGPSTFGFYGQNGTTLSQDYQPTIITTTTPTIGTWYHYALTVSPTTFTVYINGTQDGTPVSVGNAFTITSMFLARSGQTNIVAGINSVDDLRIYNTALTAAQVQAIYNQQGMPGRAANTLPAPLDSLSASGAYSTRLLKSSYTGPVVNVRRNSDNATLDFVADNFGNLSNTQSVVTIDTWLASTTGNVTTWYDQAYSNNFIQVTNASQPQIVKNGGKWVLFFNRDAAPTFYSNMYMNTNQTGIFSIVYNCNVSSTFSTWQTILGGQFNDNRGFRFDNNAIYGDSTSSGGRYNQDFLDAAGSYWYLNNQYGNMSAGGPGVASVVNPAGNNGIYTNNIWNHIIGVANGGMDTFVFNSINSPNTSLTTRAMYGYLSELIMFKTQLSDLQARSLYATQYISRSFTNLTGTPLFSQLSASATSSAVGAFSLRAVNGTTAKAVQVRPLGAFPVAAMSSNGPQTLTGYPFGGSGSYTASVSSYGGSAFGWKVFDKDPTTQWNTNYTYTGVGANNSNTYIVNTYSTTVSGATVYGEWIQIQLPTAIYPYTYTLTPPYDAPVLQRGFPYQWTLAGSNDGTTWTTVDTQNTINTWINSTPKTFTSATSSTAYSYYRLIIQAVNSYSTLTTQLVNITEWTMNGSNVSWNTDFYADRLGNLLTAPVIGQSLVNWLGGATGYIATWYDQSGKGNHATQATAANQPKIDFINKQIDFKPSAYFNLPNGTVPLLTAYTVISRHNTIQNVADGGIVGAGPRFINNSTNRFRRNNATYRNYWWANDIDIGTYAAGNVMTWKFTAETSASAGTTYVYQNSSLVNSAYRSGWVATPGNETIGTTNGSSGELLNGELYYVFLFNSALSDTDRILVESLPIT
jgi:Concanavalin A-like lectin/glucanases superfamily/Alpha-L-arabinofuranosidase B, catalytic